jgi:hypothetical protein
MRLSLEKGGLRRVTAQGIRDGRRKLQMPIEKRKERPTKPDLSRGVAQTVRRQDAVFAPHLLYPSTLTQTLSLGSRSREVCGSSAVCWQRLVWLASWESISSCGFWGARCESRPTPSVRRPLGQKADPGARTNGLTCKIRDMHGCAVLSFKTGPYFPKC